MNGAESTSSHLASLANILQAESAPAEILATTAQQSDAELQFNLFGNSSDFDLFGGELEMGCTDSSDLPL